jgi:hypothetical protein
MSAEQYKYQGQVSVGPNRKHNVASSAKSDGCKVQRPGLEIGVNISDLYSETKIDLKKYKQVRK